MRAKSHIQKCFSLLLLSSLLLSFGYCQSFTTVGTASSLGGNCYELTAGGTNQKGAIWSNTQLDLTQPFDFTFHVRFPVWGADGLAFVIHDDPAGLGAISVNPGNTIGAYNTLPGGTAGGITPGMSWELDIWDNSPAGADDIPGPCCADDHVAIMDNDNPGTAILGPVAARTGGADITDGLCRRFRCTWNPSNSRIELWLDNGLLLSGTYNIPANIFGGSTTVFWGLTGSSGGVAANFQVCMENLTELPTDTAMCPGSPISLPANSLAGASLAYNWVPVPRECPCYTYLQTCTGTCNTSFCPLFSGACPTCVSGTYSFNPPSADTCIYSIDVINGIGCRDTHFIEVRADCILPVEMGDFSAEPFENQSYLEWVTLNESNSSHFEIQHSIDGNHFFKIGEVNAAGFTSTESTYNFIHQFPELGENWYRLKLIDLDGKSNLSEVRTVNFDSPKVHDLRKVYPNPSTGLIQFEFAVKEACDIKIDVLSPSGAIAKKILWHSQSSGIKPFEADFSSLSDGLYFYHCSIGGKPFTGKFIIQK